MVPRSEAICPAVGTGPSEVRVTAHEMANGAGLASPLERDPLLRCCSGLSQHHCLNSVEDTAPTGPCHPTTKWNGQSTTQVCVVEVRAV